eukprot:jgi/Botrbrau1/1537/Bobra.0107s0025.1
MNRASLCFCALLVITLSAHGSDGKRAATSDPTAGILPDGTYDWDEIMKAGRAGALDINTNGDAIPSGAKDTHSSKANKKSTAKPPSPEEITKQWHDVLEQAKLDAMAAGAPAPGASLPDNMAPMTAPSGNPAPEDIKNTHKIKLASAHEGVSQTDAAQETGYKAREGYKPLSWLQKPVSKP